MSASRRRRLVPLLLGLAVLVGLAIFGWPRLRQKELRPGPVADVALTDVDGDGRADLIVLHEAAPDADHSLLVAIDLEEAGGNEGDAAVSGFAQPLWVARTVPTDAVPVAPVPLIVPTDGSLVVTGRFERTGRESLALHDPATGGVRSTWDVDDERDWNVATRVATDGDRVLAFSVRPTVNDARLTALDPATGDVLWEADVGHWPGAPAALGDALFVLATDGLTRVDRQTGQTQAVEGVRAGALIDATYRVVRADAAGFIVGQVDGSGRFEPTLRDDGEPLALPPGANPQTAVAFYAGNTLVAGAGVGDDALGLAALPLDAGGVAWQLAFGDRFGLLVANDDWRRVAPLSSAFFINPSRFAPAILSRELDPTHDRMKLAVIDLERGQVAWESRVLAQRPPGLWPNNLIQGAGGDFLVTLPLVDDPESLSPTWRDAALLRFDGTSGRLDGAWQIADPSSDWRFPSPGHVPRPWWWSPPVLVGFDGERLFAVDLETERMLWSSPGDLELTDVRDRVEAQLGPLP